ncbi:hypothetical protein PMAYCL1PPCAC_22567, partial [Pristionchus mayeri]
FLLIFNGLIVILIILDGDVRNKNYRKYLCSLQAMEFALFAEVVLAYFACVYYRRGLVLGSQRWFNFTGQRRVALFVFLQIYGLVAIVGLTYFCTKSAQAAELSIPLDLEWVRNKTSYLFMLPDENSRYANYGNQPISWIVFYVEFPFQCQSQ